MQGDMANNIHALEQIVQVILARRIYKRNELIRDAAIGAAQDEVTEPE